MKFKEQAKRIGITQGYWSNIRHKKIIPGLKLAKRIEKLFPEYRVVDLIPDIKKILQKVTR